MFPRITPARMVRLCLKELRESLRDRRTIVTLVLMPLLVYPLLSLVLNRVLLVVLLVLVVAYGALRWWPQQAMKLGDFFLWVESLGWWVLIFLGLLPLAMTMAMIWKAKEVILDSVFNAKPAP